MFYAIFLLICYFGLAYSFHLPLSLVSRSQSSLSPVGVTRLHKSQQPPAKHGRWGPILRMVANGEKGEFDSEVSRTAELRQQAEYAETTSLFEALIAKGDLVSLSKAVEMLRRPQRNFTFTKTTAFSLLNKVAESYFKEGEANVEATSLEFVYEELKRCGYVRAFASIDSELIPEKRRDISPFLLEKLTGMSMSSLTPTRDNKWLIAGVALCALEFFGGAAINVDALNTIIPVTAGAFLFDRIAFQGAVFESALQMFLPGYKKKILRHEAGHFLIAYLMGCPVQGCIVNPWEFRKFGTAGSGGTVFADPTFGKQLESGELKRSAIDRFSIILMAGIASEASAYGKAEGGMADEATLIQILSAVAPPFNFDQIRTQARWAACQGVLLLKEHQAALDALVDALERNESLGNCIAAIEGTFEDAPLPSAQRRIAMGSGDDSSGAVDPSSAEMKSTSNVYSVAGAWTGAGDRKALTPAQEIRSMMERAVSAKKSGTTLARVEQSTAELMEEFVNKLRALEKEAASNNLQTERVGDSGGVWLNDLKALKEVKHEPLVEVAPVVKEGGEQSQTPSAVDDLEAREEANRLRMQEVESKLSGNWPPDT